MARLGAAIVRTLQAEGIAACGKHFPGHGDTSTDSHLELPLVEHPPDRLRRVEFVPFKAAIEAGVATIMTAHVLVPALDEKRPATLSRRVVQEMLREELHYQGVILSDDLEMKAIAAEYEVPSAAVLAMQAGCDGVLICSGDHDTQAAALEALVHAVEEERVRMTRIEDALMRQRRAKERFLGARRVAAADRPGAARRARARRAPRDRRRDGALSVMRKPRALTPGDRLAVVAPASPFTREEFDRGVEEIRRLGFEPVYDESVFARQRYVAGTPQVRAAAIHAAWRDPSIAGAHRRARRLRQRAGAAAARSRRRAAGRKPFIGYSDLTAMLTFLTLQCDLIAFHGPMLAGRLGRGAAGYDATSFVRALAGASRWASCAARGRNDARGEPAACCSAARSPSCSRRSGRRSRSIRRRATCCSSTKWASGRTGSIAW